jgi:hypothetical protein
MISQLRRSAGTGVPGLGREPAVAGPGGAVSRMAQARAAAVAPSMLAWNWAPTARSGRGEQQHEQCGLVAQVPGEQPQAHLHRYQRRGQRRRQLQHQRRQERHPQRAHRRLPVRLGDLTDHLRLRLRPAEQFQGGQPFDHVEEVAAECRQQPPLPLRTGLGVQPDQDGEHRDQR